MIMGKYDDIIYNFKYKRKKSNNKNDVSSRKKQLSPEELRKKEQKDEILKQKIIDIGTKYDRLYISEISSLCGVCNTLFLRFFIEKMIGNQELAAKFLLLENIVLFDRIVNLLKLKVEKREEGLHLPSKKLSNSKNRRDLDSNPAYEWLETKENCKNCGKKISNKYQLICEYCGEDLYL
ncbi:MAG: hypothetical protein BAJALOKI1v1_900008 [Promethearchaeota archaeon]|nr:MAG: hypothetical protein BAJALOKI1v1_900008 [Candidatus Lokiarchaeota archaeon]